MHLAAGDRMVTPISSANSPRPTPGPIFGAFGVNRIQGLDGLRAIAALLVFVEHKSTYSDLGLGGAGLLLFFILSGYLITSLLLADRRAIEIGTLSPKTAILKFFASRSFRIFPAYYAMLLAWICVAVTLGHWVSKKWLIGYFTYTTNILSAHIFHKWAPLGHLWSLAVEEQFYIIAAPLFLLIPSRRARVVVAGFWVVGLMSWAVLAFQKEPLISFTTDSFINFAVLAIGSAFALSSPIRGGRNSWGVVGGLIALTAGTALVVRLLPAQSMIHWVAAPAAILLWMTLRNQRSAVVRALEITPLRWLGRVSYAFYLWHFWISLQFLAPHVVELGASPGLAAAAVFWAELLATLVAAAVSWWLIEAPALKMRQRLLVPRPMKPVVAAASS